MCLYQHSYLNLQSLILAMPTYRHSLYAVTGSQMSSASPFWSEGRTAILSFYPR
jgi:hypothetical protein